MHARGWPGVVASMTLAVAAPLHAQQDTTRADTTVFRLEGIAVQAQRPVTTIGGASAIEVDVEQLQLPASPTMEDVLREITAVHVRKNSRGEAEISVRGSESRQVAVLLDGVPLTLGWDARTDVSVLPAGAARQVSFVRGLSTLLHGPNVLGGVVEMNMTRGFQVPERGSAEASAAYDQVGGYSVSTNATLPFETRRGGGLVRAGVGFRDSPGLPLADGVAEPVPTPDGLRLNTDMRNADGFVAFRYAGDSGRWASLSAAAHDARRGIAAELGSADPRLWRYPDVSRAIFAASTGTGELTTPLGRGDLEAALGYDVGRTDIESYTTRAYDVVDGFENGDERTLTLRLLGDHTLGSRGDLRASFTYADIDRDQDVDGTISQYEQHLLSAAAETVWRLPVGTDAGIERVSLTVGGAYDQGSTPRSGGLEPLGTIEDWGARLGLSALIRDGNTMLHVGASRRGRFPALREMYSESLNRFIPNPDLRPEHLVAVETGVTTRVGEGEVQLVGFHHDLSGAIRRITFPDGMRQRVNADELRSVGVEAMVSQTWGRVGAGANLTLQSVELTDPGTALSTRPENVPEQSGTAWIRLPAVADVTARFEADYTGVQFCQDPDTGADVRLDGGTWLSAVFSRIWQVGGAIPGRLETSVAIDNLTDTAIYDQCGLPQPGRLLRFQVRVF